MSLYFLIINIMHSHASASKLYKYLQILITFFCGFSMLSFFCVCVYDNNNLFKMCQSTSRDRIEIRTKPIRKKTYKQTQKLPKSGLKVTREEGRSGETSCHPYGQQLKCNTWHTNESLLCFYVVTKYFILLGKRRKRKKKSEITQNLITHLIVGITKKTKTENFLVLLWWYNDAFA